MVLKFGLFVLGLLMLGLFAFFSGSVKMLCSFNFYLWFMLCQHMRGGVCVDFDMVYVLVGPLHLISGLAL
jgi:hypothetical protein